jgi:hypothetical protein
MQHQAAAASSWTSAGAVPRQNSQSGIAPRLGNLHGRGSGREIERSDIGLSHCHDHVLIPRNRTGRDANPARSAFLAQELIQILIVHAQPIANCERARRFVSFPDLLHIRKNDLDYKNYRAQSSELLRRFKCPPSYTRRGRGQEISRQDRLIGDIVGGITGAPPVKAKPPRHD